MRPTMFAAMNSLTRMHWSPRTRRVARVSRRNSGNRRFQEYTRREYLQLHQGAHLGGRIRNRTSSGPVYFYNQVEATKVVPNSDEQLLSALLLQVFYGIRSERQLMEQLNYNLMYRWFVGLSPDDPVWDPTTFTKYRDRLRERGGVCQVHDQASEPSAGQAAVVGRAFFRGRNAD